MTEQPLNCPHCGARLEPDEHFCPECGANLVGKRIAVVEEAPQTPQPGIQVPPSKAKKPSSHRYRSIMIVLAGIIGLIIIYGLWSSMTMPETSKPIATPTYSEPAKPEPPGPVDLDVFEVGDVQTDRDPTIVQTIKEHTFKIFPSRIGQPIPSIYAPITFNEETRDVTFNYYCSGEWGNNRIASFESSPDDDQSWYEAEYVVEDGWLGVGMTGRFGFHDKEWGGAKTLILTNNNLFGTEIEYVSPGRVNLMLYPSTNGIEGTFDCNLAIISRNPPHRVGKEFTLEFVCKDDDSDNICDKREEFERFKTERGQI